ncbi:maker591 [Drosophila busckii]|uniref:Maker591 n=2 Tax=Drosophila busckii TaxID=30019 RepID=A0A0M4E342_DROBS|nr:maker591 [Drosophila busckii]
MNPFYVGPYPDQACGSCPYGIFSGFVPCGWPNRCADKNKQPKECEAKETKDAKQTNGAKETASPKECD